MEKIGRLIKSISENYIKKNLEEVDCIFLLNYSGVNAVNLSTLRSRLKSLDASFTVVKNSIAGRVFKEKGYAGLVNMLEGPCGIVWVKGDVIEISKTILDFAKENQTLKVRGGLLKDRILGSEDISLIAKLPNQSVLYSQLVQALKGPINVFVLTLKELLNRLVRLLDKIKEKK
jgi:large subunit ribosomal protein L10